MSDYFYIYDNKIIGCGQGRIVNEGYLNVEVSPDMVNYTDDPSWESERFKWKYKWDGEKIIDNPDFEAEETVHYNEAMRQARLEAYMGETDGLASRKIRKQALNDWSEEDEEEFKKQMEEISKSIEERYPYRR